MVLLHPIFVFMILPGFRVVQQYQKGVVFLFGKITGIKEPGLVWIIPYFSMDAQSGFAHHYFAYSAQRIITKDNVSLDVSAVAYYKIVDVTKSIVAIENVMSAINQLSQTTMRNIVGKFQLDEILSERDDY